MQRRGLPVNGDAVIEGGRPIGAGAGGRRRKRQRRRRRRNGTTLAETRPRADAAMDAVGLHHLQRERELVAQRVVAAFHQSKRHHDSDDF